LPSAAHLRKFFAKVANIHQRTKGNALTRLVMITFSVFYAYHWEIIRIFVVRIWQIRKEAPKTDPSLKEQR
jgi:hypothetical protein